MSSQEENNSRRRKLPALLRQEESKRGRKMAAQEEYKRESNNPSTEEVLACLQSIESAALRTGELSKEDKLQVKRRYGCSAAIVKQRFDARGTPTPKRGKKAASILELADRFELSALQKRGEEADGCDAADIAALCKEARVFAVHRRQILEEICLRHHDKHESYFGRTTGLKQKLFMYVGGAQYTIFLSAYNFSLMELAIKLAEAKAKGVRVVILADKKTMWNIHCHKVYEYLLWKNFEVYVPNDSAMEHAKVWIIDGRIIIEGSFNLSAAALGAEGEHKPRNTESSMPTTNREQAKQLEADFWAACQAGKLVKTMGPVSHSVVTSA